MRWGHRAGIATQLSCDTRVAVEFCRPGPDPGYDGEEVSECRNFSPYGVNLTLAMPTMDDYIATHDSTRWIIDLRNRQDTEIISMGH